jgi:hypothetical protein
MRGPLPSPSRHAMVARSDRTGPSRPARTAPRSRARQGLAARVALSSRGSAAAASLPQRRIPQAWSCAAENRKPATAGAAKVQGRARPEARPRQARLQARLRALQAVTLRRMAPQAHRGPTRSRRCSIRDRPRTRDSRPEPAPPQAQTEPATASERVAGRPTSRARPPGSPGRERLRPASAAATRVRPHGRGATGRDRDFRSQQLQHAAP